MPKSRFSLALIITITGFVWISSFMSKADLGHIMAMLDDTAQHAALEIELFAVHNTISWDTRDPEREKYQLPVLYLHLERNVTSASSRMLEIHITGLSGVHMINLEIVSRHVDISTGMQYTITKPVAMPDRNCTADSPCVVKWLINPQTTPSDFYTLVVRDTDGHILWKNPYMDRPDFALLETWDISLDDYTARIIYATLFPFAKGENDFQNRLAPAAVIDFIEQQFVPIITETWHTQFNLWGLGKPIHPAWDADKIYEIIITDAPFALFGDIGLGSQFIDRNNQPSKECRLWWASSANTYQAYNTLEDAVKAVYSHEFFHLVQRNILLFTEHPDHRWMNLFIEAQGKFAPTVQYPDMEIRRYHVGSQHQSEYLSAANRMLTQRLNSSYRDLESDPIHRYDYALYWRFLYEQYGDMQVILTALQTMTKWYQQDPIRALAMTMDEVFGKLDGPYESFEESIVAFARANYALRLQDGRCKETDFVNCGGFYYDPSNTYAEPPIEAELVYNETALIYDGAIPASYGMDFLEILLEKRSFKQPVSISVEGLSNVARFNVQLWKVLRACPKQHAITPYPASVLENPDGIHRYVLASQDRLEYDKLVLIITRLDAQELIDPNGHYTVRVVSDSW